MKHTYIYIIMCILLCAFRVETATDSTFIGTGKATYYAHRFHGKRMSNGENYDKNGFTCAHRKLPFGTKLRVVNKVNGKSTVVRVTDRGPFGKGKIVDLSYAAAREIDMIRAGVVNVDVFLYVESDSVESDTIE